jgi:hypothetical protein
MFQNDVKFLQTNAGKVLVKFFQKLAGCGAEPHIKHTDKSKFVFLLCGGRKVLGILKKLLKKSYENVIMYRL